MASIAQIGPILGFGGRAHVFEAITVEAEPIALKAYHAKLFCKKELSIYEYLKKSGRHPKYLPQYHGPISLTPDHVRTIESSIHDARGDTAATIYRVGVGIERIRGSCLGELVNDMTDGELKSFEEKILAALSDLHKSVEICHKDIKADNILLLPPHTPRSNGFIIIDLSEGIIRKDTSDATWKKACKEDIQALREIFRDARSAKAVLAGCKLIQDATSISYPANTSDDNIPKRLSDDVQIQLSHFLTSAQSAKSVSRLIDRILPTIKRPICELAVALVRALRCIGRFSDALHVLESCVTAGSGSCDTVFLPTPTFDFQKAKVLQSLGLDSVPYFSSALLGFEAQLGADHITTQSCRYELALQYARSSDTIRAKTILSGLAKYFAGKTSLTKRENRLFRELGRLRLPTTPESRSKTQKRPADISLTEVSLSAKRSRRA